MYTFTTYTFTTYTFTTHLHVLLENSCSTACVMNMPSARVCWSEISVCTYAMSSPKTFADTSSNSPRLMMIANTCNNLLRTYGGITPAHVPWRTLVMTYPFNSLRWLAGTLIQSLSTASRMMHAACRRRRVCMYVYIYVYIYIHIYIYIYEVKTLGTDSRVMHTVCSRDRVLCVCMYVCMVCMWDQQHRYCLI